jgi:hypothetical protein
MLRRIPATPLVCLAIFLTTIIANATWAAGPDESLEILLKPNQAAPSPVPAAHKTKAARRVAPQGYIGAPGMACLPPPPFGIAKVKPAVCGPFQMMPGCILPKLRQGQWEASVQAFFARSRGTIAYPRYSIFYNPSTGWNNEADLNDALGLPAHKVVMEASIRYQFRPNWGIQYSVLADEFRGGKWVDTQFVFGTGVNQFFFYGQQIQTKWQHGYHRVGLVYDALRTCQASVSVFANWVHAEDKIDVNCQACGLQTSTFSKGTDAAMAGVEFQRCIKTAPNGGTLSCDSKIGFIFLDDVEGWDVQVGGRYSVPLGCGRWGFMKGGYRYVELKKTQYDFLFKNTLEGGYVEGGFVF